MIVNGTYWHIPYLVSPLNNKLSQLLRVALMEERDDFLFASSAFCFFCVYGISVSSQVKIVVLIDLSLQLTFAEHGGLCCLVCSQRSQCVDFFFFLFFSDCDKWAAGILLLEAAPELWCYLQLAPSITITSSARRSNCNLVSTSSQSTTAPRSQIHTNTHAHTHSRLRKPSDLGCTHSDDSSVYPSLGITSANMWIIKVVKW